MLHVCVCVCICMSICGWSLVPLESSNGWTNFDKWNRVTFFSTVVSHMGYKKSRKMEERTSKNNSLFSNKSYLHWMKVKIQDKSRLDWNFTISCFYWMVSESIVDRIVSSNFVIPCAKQSKVPDRQLFYYY